MSVQAKSARSSVQMDDVEDVLEKTLKNQQSGEPEEEELAYDSQIKAEESPKRKQTPVEKKQQMAQHKQSAAAEDEDNKKESLDQSESGENPNEEDRGEPNYGEEGQDDGENQGENNKHHLGDDDEEVNEEKARKSPSPQKEKELDERDELRKEVIRLKETVDERDTEIEQLRAELDAMRKQFMLQQSKSDSQIQVQKRAGAITEPARDVKTDSLWDSVYPIEERELVYPQQFQKQVIDKMIGFESLWVSERNIRGKHHQSQSASLQPIQLSQQQQQLQQQQQQQLSPLLSLAKSHVVNRNRLNSDIHPKEIVSARGAANKVSGGNGASSPQQNYNGSNRLLGGKHLQNPQDSATTSAQGKAKHLNGYSSPIQSQEHSQRQIIYQEKSRSDKEKNNHGGLYSPIAAAVHMRQEKNNMQSPSPAGGAAGKLQGGHYQYGKNIKLAPLSQEHQKKQLIKQI